MYYTALHCTTLRYLHCSTLQLQIQPNGPETGLAFSNVFMFSLCFYAMKTWELPHVYIQPVGILQRNSSGIYEKCGFYYSGS